MPRAKERRHGAYNPTTGLLYTPVVDVCGTFKLIPEFAPEAYGATRGSVLFAFALP